MSSLQDTVEILSSSSPPWWAQPRYAIGVLAAIVGVLLWFLIAVVHAEQKDILDRVTATERWLEVICLNTAGNDPTAIARCQGVNRR